MAAGVAEFRRENSEKYYSTIPELPVPMRVKHQCLKSVEVMMNF
jgi:hypothetical protein